MQCLVNIVIAKLQIGRFDSFWLFESYCNIREALHINDLMYTKELISGAEVSALDVIHWLREINLYFASPSLLSVMQVEVATASLPFYRAKPSRVLPTY